MGKMPEDTPRDTEGRGKVEPVFTPEDYKAVVNSAKLATINLVKCNFNIEEEYYLETKAKKNTYSVKIHNGTYDDENGIAAGNFVWNLAVLSGRKKLLSLTADYLLVYENIKDMKVDAVIAFVHKVGSFATYPYFRSHVSHMSWASNAELPIMPILR